ncbi:MAG: hypothetical protein H0X17_18895, partial [Deltaproteobacteria bacterium]|nr:hypothetical protein [Deltaproteobacteria bacterium]
MPRSRLLVLLVMVVLLVQGCVYAGGNLAHSRKSGYTNYPSSIEAEHERRKRRRRRALIAAPIEIAAGLAITALALYAPVKPSDADSTTGALADAGKEVLGRFLAATAGTAIALSGVGDGFLGLVDPAFRSPLVRAGRLVPAAEIDALAPPRGPRLDLHATSVIGTAGVGADTGIGLAHWITPALRLRHAVSAELTLPFRSADRRLVISGETVIERAFGRERAGLYPRRSIGLYLGGGWAAIEDREDLPVLRAGVMVGT